jgi:signal transduction histidine kinase
MRRSLIQAQEEERAWIARELHDDISQRIALVAIGLEQLEAGLPESAGATHDQIRQFHRDLVDINNAIHALSHRLHSSKLDIGIVAAARSLCRELCEQHKVEIDFSNDGIVGTIPKDISLCLFRILQEALQNAVKHSGVRRFRVELCGTEDEIQLTVSDAGMGFDVRAAANFRGLGLVSMRERAKLVNGSLSVASAHSHGTTIHVRVPLQAQEHSARLDE